MCFNKKKKKTWIDANPFHVGVSIKNQFMRNDETVVILAKPLKILLQNVQDAQIMRPSQILTEYLWNEQL